jgi:dual specificity phosphatase 12
MCTEGLSVAAAQQSVRDAREQIWIRPSLVEQLVVFELCQFQPRTDHPMYAKWRASRDLAAIAGQLSAYEK